MIYQGPAAEITKATVVVDGGLAVGSATVQLRINGTNVTDGSVTFPLVGTAAESELQATPSAANVLAKGDRISAHVSGLAVSAGVTATITLELSAPV